MECQDSRGLVGVSGVSGKRRDSLRNGRLFAETGVSGIVVFDRFMVMDEGTGFTSGYSIDYWDGFLGKGDMWGGGGCVELGAGIL